MRVVVALSKFARGLPDPLYRIVRGLYRSTRYFWLVIRDLPARLLSPARGTASEVSVSGWRTPARRRKVVLVVSPNEISFAHGTGVLLTRLIDDRKDVVLMRSQTSYGGHQEPDVRAAFALPSARMRREEIFRAVVAWLHDFEVTRIICVPYFTSDLEIAMAAEAITGAPLAIWIMDDNCLVSHEIPEPTMRHALERATALFSISPEMRTAYEARFRKKMWILPPLVREDMLLTADTPEPEDGERRLVMIGNVWSKEWFEALRRIVAESAIHVEWYTSESNSPWLHLDAAELSTAGIEIKADRKSSEQVAAMRSAAVIIVPTDPHARTSGSHRAIGDYSLPTRVPFAMATSGTPILVVGRADTAVARFVERMGVGAHAPYEAAALTHKIDELSKPEKRTEIRRRSLELAPAFSFDGVWQLVQDTTDNEGIISDRRFERLFPPRANEFAYYCEEPVPSSIFLDFREPYTFCRRLKRQGLEPNFVLDVGASNGIWAHYVAKVFGQSRFVLCDPLFSTYSRLWTNDDFTLVEKAISDSPGTATFQVSGDLFGSSLIAIGESSRCERSITVETTTVDDVVREHALAGWGMLKVDVQFAEHLVIEGARAALKEQIKIVLLELTLTRIDERARTMREMINLMDSIGFRPYDEVGSWRSPRTGELTQMDIAFVRDGFLTAGPH